ncbi:MAG: hypothetical protein RIC87_12685 [Kiloniellales bacterium]
MSKSDDFINQGHAELERWRKRLADLEEMADKHRSSVDGHISDMKERMKKAEENLKQAQAAGSEQAQAYQEQAKAYQERMKTAWSSLEEGFQKAMRDLKS